MGRLIVDTQTALTEVYHGSFSEPTPYRLDKVSSKMPSQFKRSLTISIFVSSILVLLSACGGESLPTATPGLAQPTAQELKQAGQELFDTFSASIATGDAAGLHGIFVADIRERCTVEQSAGSVTL